MVYIQPPGTGKKNPKMTSAWELCSRANSETMQWTVSTSKHKLFNRALN